MKPAFGHIVRASAMRALAALAGAAMLAGAGVTAVSAQSLKEMRAQQSEESDLEDQANYTRQLCGINFDVVIDWPSFSSWPAGADVARACDRGLSEIETDCRNGKAPRVTRFVCTGDGSGFSNRGGVVQYGASAR